MTDLAFNKPSPGSTAEALLHFVIVFLLLCLSIALFGFEFGGKLCFAIWLVGVITNVQSAKRPADRSFKLWRRGIREDLEEHLRSFKSWRRIRGKLAGGLWNILHIFLGITLAAIITVFLNAVFFIFPNELNILLIPDARALSDHSRS